MRLSAELVEAAAAALHEAKRGPLGQDDTRGQAAMVLLAVADQLRAEGARVALDELADQFLVAATISGDPDTWEVRAHGHVRALALEKACLTTSHTYSTEPETDR